MNLWR